ncbi:PD-(D/E)XK motif protein [Lacticaseibacillus nasuensis]|uniref:PD-(D/E)XK motif protein n=1 Tax=Lacticaseibacillus nasuensis TaxID=944671 RepID=UPI002247AE8E|nr:PD-(D/E)XK motif protein [Lacticaseibacillus nasuensis]
MTDEALTGSNQYRRVKDTNLFGFYVGTDDQGRFSFLVKLSKDPRLSFGSKFLICTIRQRTVDTAWAMTVSIDNDRYLGVFKTMVDDLVATVSDAGSAIVAEQLFLARFNDWRTLFAKRVEQKLDRATIIGLAGELYFISKVVLPKFGPEVAVASWGGPESTNQDFTFNFGWVEIKTRGSNKSTVHISNSKQLTGEGAGHLVILPIILSTREDKKAYSLMSLYHDIVARLTDPDCKMEFDRKLALVGFVPDPKYIEPCFRFEQFDYYQVTDEFPRIVQGTQSPAISAIEYDLYVPDLAKFQVGGLNDGHVS